MRGSEIAMIFQEPMTALNPLLTVGRQIAEMLVLHEGLARGAARRGAVEMLRPRAHPRTRAARAASIRTRCRAACGSGR